jgi:pyridoxamine 5'-phosphate oxidase
MINIKKICKNKPYSIFKEKYLEAYSAGQKNIEAMVIASYNANTEEVDARYVNLKLIDKDQFVFFTNYKSPKSEAFQSHDQISATFLWTSVSTQIRIKAKITKTSKNFNQKYFQERNIYKNALAISSKQSQPIDSFNNVIQKYNETKKCNNLTKCPEYWGGFAFVPFEIEFWEGNEFRLNKRNLYKNYKNKWNHSILEP